MKKTVTVELDRKRKLSWDNRAQYRLGSLARPPRPHDFANPRKSFSALCAFLWAMVEGDDFAAPEDIAPHVDSQRALELMHAVLEAFPKAEDAGKNGDGSTPSSSPASS